MTAPMSCVPLNLPDELLRSYAIRAYFRNGHANPATTMAHLFGGATTRVINFDAHFSGNFDHLAAVLNGAFSSDALIAEHTFLPLFASFFPAVVMDRARQHLRRGAPHRVSNMLGHRGASRWRTENLALCPRCIRDDERRHGFGYWRRIHQLHTVVYCPFHDVQVLDSCPHCQEPLIGGRDWRLPSLQCWSCGQALSVQASDDEGDAGKFWKRLSSFSQAALENGLPHFNEASRRAAYAARAEERGYGSGSTQWQRLARALSSSVGSVRLEHMGLGLQCGPSQGWPGLAMLGLAYASDPFANLLLMALLFDSPRDYAAACSANSVRETSGKKSALFLRGAVSFGLLRALLREPCLERIAQKYGMDTRAIQILLRGHDKLARRREARLKQGEFKRKRDRCRTAILNAMETGSIRALSDLCNSGPHYYQWLRAHDREWLEGIAMPLRGAGKPATKISSEQLAQLDQDMANKVERLAQAEIEGTGSVTRMTRQWFLGRMDACTVHRLKKGKLLLTADAIERRAETKESFAARTLLRTVLTLRARACSIDPVAIGEESGLPKHTLNKFGGIIEMLSSAFGGGIPAKGHTELAFRQPMVPPSVASR